MDSRKPAPVTYSNGTVPWDIESLGAMLKQQGRAGYMGSENALPQFASDVDSLSVLGGSPKDRADRVFTPTVAAHSGPAIVVSRNPALRNETAAARSLLAGDNSPVLELSLGTEGHSQLPQVAHISRSFEDGVSYDDNLIWIGRQLDHHLPKVSERSRQLQTLAMEVKWLLTPLMYARQLLGQDVEQLVADLSTQNWQPYLEGLRRLSEGDLTEHKRPSHRATSSSWRAEGAESHALDRLEETLGLLTNGNRAFRPTMRQITDLAIEVLEPFEKQQQRALPSLTADDLDAFVQGNGTIYVTVGGGAIDDHPVVVDLLQEVSEIMDRKFGRTGLNGTNKADPALLVLIDEAEVLCPPRQLSLWLNAGYKDRMKVVAGLTSLRAVEAASRPIDAEVLITTDSHALLSIGGFGSYKGFDFWANELATKDDQGRPRSGHDIDYPPKGKAFRVAPEDQMRLVDLVPYQQDPYWGPMLQRIQRVMPFEQTGRGASAGTEL